MFKKNNNNIDYQTKEIELYPEGNKETLKMADEGSS